MNTSCLLVHDAGDPSSQQHLLESAGFHPILTPANRIYLELPTSYMAIILSITYSQLQSFLPELPAIRTAPVIWWNAEQTLPPTDYKQLPGIDGIIHERMSTDNIRWSLLVSQHTFYTREALRQERDDLLYQLEGRRWVDKAKSILCEIKNIPETEAYAILRKQAMDERKKIADVAASIVKVYKLLQEQKRG